MALLDLTKLTTDLSSTWAGYLRDWDRTLRAGNYPETTRYNYLLAAAQLARYLAEHSPDPDAVDAAKDPTEVTRGHAEAFQAWMIETRSPSTALNKHKGLQQFFKWLLAEEDIDRSPMDRVRQPKTPQKLIPIIQTRTRRSSSTPARARPSRSCATRRSFACTTTRERGCRRSATCCSTMWT
ncbi:phage integrase N-terminal SAM-like domain-containing protein [Micromonospora sp. NPDC049114]|uniref:phage integrase N-terminal SAM-like domain-containing protein n=1 Tax=Micromonospora sp. NPDC049114 TaxID=3155498 RepID=UPI00340F29EA